MDFKIAVSIKYLFHNDILQQWYPTKEFEIIETNVES